MAKLLTKRSVLNSFVSKISLRFKSIDLSQNKSFIVKHKFDLMTNKSQVMSDTCLINARHLSSKSSEQKFKDMTSNQKMINSSEDLPQNLKPSTKSKFKEYSDRDAEVIYDVSEELFAEEKSETIVEEWDESKEERYLYQQKARKSIKQKDLDIERGVTGVFDIDQLVDLLRSENLKEIAVIEVPEELNYCQFLVLANCASKRHMNAFLEYFNKVYKMKKARHDPFLNFGGDAAPDWKCVDMTNIVLHLFMKETREKYDIETLWTVGHEFDDKTQKPETDSVIDIMEKHIKYLEEIKPKY